MVERLQELPLVAMPMLSFRTVVRGEKLVPLAKPINELADCQSSDVFSWCYFFVKMH